MSWYIDVDFPGANACGAAIACMDGDPAVSLTPHPMDAPEAMWFRFRLRCLASAAPAPWLLLRHVSTLLGGRDGSDLQPVTRCDGGEWLRLKRGDPILHEDGCCDVRWQLPRAAACIEVAFCYPYEQDDLDRLVAATGLRLQAVGASERGRPLLRLDNGSGELGSGRPGLFVIARQHSGETPASWVMDGLLSRIAELGQSAPLTWAIPFGDTDGVVEGRYGKDRHPVDINRSWPGADSIPRRHEVLCWVQQFHHWRARCAPSLLLDLHAPCAYERTGVYAFIGLGVEDPPSVAVSEWAERLCLGIAAPWAAERDFGRVGDWPTRWSSGTHLTCASWTERQGVPALALETTYQGQRDRAFSIADYRTIGSRIANVVASQ